MHYLATQAHTSLPALCHFKEILASPIANLSLLSLLSLKKDYSLKIPLQKLQSPNLEIVTYYSTLANKVKYMIIFYRTK